MTATHCAFKILVAVALFAGANTVFGQQHCWVKYTYDAAGNRIQRSWWCGVPGPDEELLGGPKAAQAEKGYGLVAAPNPANTEFTLRSEVDLAGAECRITDSQGSTVLTQRASGTTSVFNVAGFAAGAYTLHVPMDTDEFQTKTLIAR